MAMDGQRNGHGRNVTCHPTRYNSPIKMMRTQSDTWQTLSSPTVATTARIHRSTSVTRSIVFMLGQWVDRDQRLERLRPLPAIRQLLGVQRCPFAHKSQREVAATR
jgi:hypothetical protein